MTDRAIVDGIPVDSLPITDSLVVRGDGCFEAVRSYRGVLWQLDAHLDRLERSAGALGLPVPDRARISDWAHAVAGSENGIVRIILSRGDAVPGSEKGARCLVFLHPLPPPKQAVRLTLVPAPWHPAGRKWALAGVKTTSYAPNAAATRTARERGFDDALLVGDSGVVLEGPTFSVAWVVGGRLETPALDLGILASITRQCSLVHAANLGLEVVEGRWGADRLREATELLAWSTVKEVCPVVELDGRSIEPGPVTAALSDAFGRAVRSANAGAGGFGELAEGA